MRQNYKTVNFQISSVTIFWVYAVKGTAKSPAVDLFKLLSLKEVSKPLLFHRYRDLPTKIIVHKIRADSNVANQEHDRQNRTVKNVVHPSATQTTKFH